MAQLVLNTRFLRVFWTRKASENLQKELTKLDDLTA